jgi:hypothetical protein
MPEWLPTVTTGPDLSAGEIAVRLGLAVVAGLMVAAIGHAAHGHRKPDAPMLLTTLVLLTVLIAMVTLVIGNSVARAFGLVGALSIVRFRTVVDDTRDTAFVIFAVIVGMAIGAGTFLVPLVGVPLVGVVAIRLGRWRTTNGATPPTHTLIVRLGLGRDPATMLGVVLDRHLPSRTITAAATARQGAAIDFTYTVAFFNSDALPQLVADLNQIEGVQSVDVHRR